MILSIREKFISLMPGRNSTIAFFEFNRKFSRNMNLRLLYLLLSAIAAIGIYSCGNDQDYPHTYTFDSFSTGELKGITNSGWITEDSLLKKFITGYEEFFWTESNQEHEFPEIEIECISDKKARFIHTNKEVYEFDLIRKNGILYFQSTDTIVQNVQFTHGLFRFSPLFFSTLMNYPGHFVTLFAPCIYAWERDREIRIMQLSWIEKQYLADSSIYNSQGGGNAQNAMHPAYLSKIASSPLIDTLVYQENEIIFIHK